MPYDEKLALRVREIMKDKPGYIEHKMFGGMCFMLRGHMCCGIVKDDLMLRVGPDQYEGLLKKPHARKMDFTGRPMKGMIYVSAEGTGTPAALKKWVEYAVNFNSSLPRK
ncbi:MAG: TfoX/Sxy family protein [Candidatus Omnitrophota bacterium]